MAQSHLHAVIIIIEPLIMSNKPCILLKLNVVSTILMNRKYYTIILDICTAYVEFHYEYNAPKILRGVNIIMVN